MGSMLKVDASGWLEGVRRVVSPNCDARPRGVQVEVLIVHAISLPPGQFGGDAVEQLFTNQLDCHTHPSYFDLQGVHVSAHVFVRRNGDVVQFVSFDDRAWHAGVSFCEGRERVNDFSIGIELEGTDFVGFDDRQYEALVAVTGALQRAYPALTVERVYGHADIAPGRKTDPGPHFDWQRYRLAVREQSRGFGVHEGRV